jgi:hypothetical protein
MKSMGFQRYKQARAILRSLKSGASLVQSCKGIGIDVSTFWKWRQKSPKLEAKVYEIMDSRISIVEDALYNAAVKGNVKACETFLFNRAHTKWKNSASVNNIIKIDNNKDKDEAEAFKVRPRIIFTDAKKDSNA